MSMSTAYRFARVVALAAVATFTMAFTEPGSAARTDPRAPEQGSSSAARTATPDPDREICVRAQLTGSRLNRRICRTQRQWDEDGGVPTER